MILDRLLFAKHLEKHEKILYVVHRHWTRLFGSGFLVAFFGIFMPWMLYAMGWNTEVFFRIAILWSVAGYLLFMHVFMDWYADAWLITDMGVIEIEWNSLVNNAATRLGYEDIEAVAYEIRGFWPTILRYGTATLRVQSGNHFVMEHCANPKGVEMKVAHYQETYMNDRGMQDAEGLKSLLSDMVAQHMRNRHK